MIVDCNECAVRGPACADCVVTVLLGMPTVSAAPKSGVRATSVPIHLEQEECAAIDVLSAQGLVPRLRLVTSRIPTAISKDNGIVTKSDQKHIV
nr:hypothetical protein [Aldersonia kunmingensis]